MAEPKENSKKHEVRVRISLPAEAYESLKKLKKCYGLDYSKLCSIMVIRKLKEAPEDLFY